MNRKLQIIAMITMWINVGSALGIASQDHQPRFDVAHPPTILFDNKTFCSRLKDRLETSVTLLNLQQSHSGAALHLRDMIVRKLRQGKHSGFQNLAAIDPEIKRYLHTDAIISQALGLRQETLILHQVDDLKYLANAQEKRDVLVMMNRPEIITPKRAKSLISVAKFRKIRIHFIWHHADDQLSQDRTELRTLFMVSALTGGRVLDLRMKDPCN